MLFVSVLLLVVSLSVSFVVEPPTYLALDASLVLGFIVATKSLFFLLSIAIAIISSTDRIGRLQAPYSLRSLLCWILLIPQGGLAIGGLLNYESSLEIELAASNYQGAAVVFGDNGVAILDGKIGFRTLETLRKGYRSQVSLLELNSPGGLIDAALEIGQFIKSNNINILVERDCESACVIVALSGVQLYVSSDARFGFHRGKAVASSDSQLGTYIGRTATNDLVHHLNRLGLPEQILRKVEQTPSDDMYYLSGERFYEIGLAHHLVD